MAFDNYQYEEEKAFEPLKVGDYKIRVAEAEKLQSQSGKDMLKLVFEVSGTNHKIYHYIVDGQYFNANISRFFDAFPQIKKGDFNVAGWVGKIGACHTKQEEYNGNTNAKVHYFIPASKQDGLAWVEPEKTEEKKEEPTGSWLDNTEELPFE